MTAGDIYHVVGSLNPHRHAVGFIGGATDDGIQVDAFAAARVAANDKQGTLSAWFMVPDITGNYCIFGAGDASAVEYLYLDVLAGKLHAKAAKAGPNIAWDLVATTKNVTPHQWHHVALVHDGVQAKIYLDGELLALTETDVTEATYWFDDLSLLDGAHIGAADSIAGGGALTLEYKGLISDVKYWNANLDLSQVKDDYEGVANTTNLTDHWDMNNGYVNVVTAANNGTNVGDNILYNNASEFTSRLRYEPAAQIVVADVMVGFSISDGRGDALIVKAA